MMRGALAGYLRRTLLTQTLGVLVALTALLQVLELLDVTTDILKRHLGFGGVLHYAGLRIPTEMTLSLPLAMLIGSLFTFHTLARNHEYIAIRAAGIRLRSMLVAMLPVAMGFAALQFVVADRLVPAAETSLFAWWQASALPDEDDDKEKPLSWFRTDRGLVSVEKASGNGRHLDGVTVYLRDDHGLYQGRISAASADWIEKGWQLTDTASLTLQPNGEVARKQEARAPWATNLRPDDLRRLDAPAIPQSSETLRGVLAGERVGDRPNSYYRTALYRSFAAPLALAVMLLLALPATTSVQRGGGGGGALLTGLGGGLALVLVSGLLGSLGQGGRLPPLLAAALPVLLFGGLGLFWLHRYDRS